MNIKDRVYKHTSHGLEEGTITKIDRTCYHDNHSESDPWVTIVWDTDPNSISSSFAVWSVHSAYGTELTLQNIEN